MITRTGRVVIMDFGIASQEEPDKTVSVSGTPNYMAPEQLRGEAVDARSDVYAAGIVLAEMVSSDGTLASREALWAGLRREPPTLPDTPWHLPN